MESAHEKLKVFYDSVGREFAEYRKECEELLEAAAMLESESDRVERHYGALELTNNLIREEQAETKDELARAESQNRRLEFLNNELVKELAECKNELAKATGAHRNDVDMDDSVCNDEGTDYTGSTIPVSEYERFRKGKMAYSLGGDLAYPHNSSTGGQVDAASMSHGTGDTEHGKKLGTGDNLSDAININSDSDTENDETQGAI
ncbi:hypothetical protein CYMTET_44360 [Cymbomonas tetramitiformis]|uniref:Uncharacterized protein n=1 Tax=Cymbomonas tetramitiformis TaxID=36881 RepID=A0AAE0C1Q3_9CHLO|nr:hypothetical protein CYMTET_44360 [Cymbomonas tetramitiformis]